MSISFGNVGVCVEGHTEVTLYALLKEHGLEDLIDDKYQIASKPFNQDMYLQSDVLGPYVEDITLTINSGFIHYVTDMDNYLLILRVGILDTDAANRLIDELYSQGLIKPRNKHEMHSF